MTVLMGRFWDIYFKGIPPYLGREDVLDLGVFSRHLWTGDVRVAAAADSGLEKHAADCGCRGPAHRAVTDLCRRYTART